MPNPRLIEASYVTNFKLRLKFSNNVEGIVDLADELAGPVFEPLRNPDFFRQYRLDPELHTIVWPNGADFAPEFLLERLSVAV